MSDEAPAVNLAYLTLAFARFREATVHIADDVHRDGAIQRFEYVLELAWKTARRLLEVRGVEANSPREAFRLAAREAIVDDPAPWFRYLTLRSLAPEAYQEAIAAQIAEAFPDFTRDVELLVAALQACPECSP